MNTINLNTIAERIQQLAAEPQPKASWWHRIWRPSSPLERLLTLAEREVACVKERATHSSDPKLKRLLVEQLLTLRSTLEKTLPNSPLYTTVHNALLRGDQSQEIWGTSFSPEQAYSGADWEKTLLLERDLPSTPPSRTKYVIHLVSLVWTQLLSLIRWCRWWDPILTSGPHQTQIFLGALPLSTLLRDDSHSFQQMGIGAILSVVEPFETEGNRPFFTQPIPPHTWQQTGIKQLRLAWEDYTIGTMAEIEKGVEFIRWNVENNRPVYVHCKAGRGRSFFVLAAYLVKYEGLSAEEACARIRSKRPQAGFPPTNPRMEILRAYAKRNLRL
jgi:atypical dual specificity phosphatase